MFYILETTSCQDYTIAYFFSFVQKILTLVQIIVPILLLISLIIFLSKIVINPDDEKKKTKSILIRVLAMIFVFILPWIIEVALNLITVTDKADKSSVYTLGNCWKNASSIRKKIDETEEQTVNPNGNKTQIISGGKNNGIPENKENSNTGKGKGAVKNVQISYNVKDSKGRCGKGSGDKCSAVATVKYQQGTVKYYIGYQNNAGLLGGSCRSHAFTSAVNAIKGSNMSTLDLQNYLKKAMPSLNGVLKAKNLNKALDHYGVKAIVYHSELSTSEAAIQMRKAIKNGQPVMIFVAHSKCSDLAGTHHAYLVLDIDDNDHVVMIDSCNYPRQAGYKKRTPEQLAKCLSPKKISDNYYRMIIFSFE